MPVLPKINQATRMVWIALVVSNLMLAGVIWFLHQTQPVGPTERSAENLQDTQTLVIVFAAISMLQMLLSTQFIPTMLLQNLQARQEEDPTVSVETRANQTYLTLTILRCALAESSSIFGVILVFLGASLEVSLGFVVWGLLGMLAAMPNEHKLAEITRALRK
jgi:hypothetical protein